MVNGNKNTRYEEGHVMNISAKFQLHTPYGFWEEDFWIYLGKFRLSVPMATNHQRTIGSVSLTWELSMCWIRMFTYAEALGYKVD